MTKLTAIIVILFTAAEAFTSPTILQQNSFSSSLGNRETKRFYSDEAFSTTSMATITDDVVLQNRMRKLYISEQKKKRQDQQKQQIQEKDTKENNNNNIIEVTTLEEYKNVVAEEKDALVLVRFYAPWCRACKAMAPFFRKLSMAYSSSSSSSDYNKNGKLPVKFVQVPISKSNSYLHQGLGVPSIPYCHIYHPTAGLVEELRFTKKCVRNVASLLQTYVEGECTNLELDEELEMYTSPYRGED